MFGGKGTRTAALAAAFAMAPLSPAAAQLERAQVGVWSISSYFERGAFVHCAMSASYAGGAKLLLVALGARGITIGIVDRSWNLRTGDTLSVFYQIDGGPASLATGRVQREYLVAARLALNSGLLERLRYANTLRVGVVGSPEFETNFSIPGSNPAIERLAACTLAGLRGNPPPRGDQRVEARPNRAAPPPAAPKPVERGAPGEPKRTGSATGFYISTAGHILTAAHVVDQCKSIRTQLIGDTPFAATVIAKSEADDLALLKTSAKPAAAATLRLGPFRLGEPIVQFGFPLSDALASSGNLTTGVVAALAGPRDDHRKIQTSAPTQAGNSGGPVLDMRGRVVAVTVSAFGLKFVRSMGTLPQNVNFAVKASVAMSFIEAHGVTLAPQAVPEQDLQVPDVAERARAFTVRIDCFE